jgi:hypothetical protein
MSFVKGDQDICDIGHTNSEEWISLYYYSIPKTKHHASLHLSLLTTELKLYLYTPAKPISSGNFSNR